MSTGSNSREILSPAKRSFDNRTSADSKLSIDFQTIQEGALQINENDQRLLVLITDLPQLQPVFAYACALLNVAIPGSGTVLASVLGYESCNKTHLVVGCLQFLTSIYVVGWVWSIYWGYLILKSSVGD